MYFGGTIMSFALPLGAFIAIGIALFFLFTAKHSGPKLRYLATASLASVGTREPAPVAAPPAAAVVELAADPETPITAESVQSQPVQSQPVQSETTGPEPEKSDSQPGEAPAEPEQ
jgi:hypothetical protein